MLLLWWCPFKIQKEKRAGLQFTSTDYLRLFFTPLRIRWTIPLKWYLPCSLWIYSVRVSCFNHSWSQWRKKQFLTWNAQLFGQFVGQTVYRTKNCKTERNSTTPRTLESAWKPSEGYKQVRDVGQIIHRMKGEGTLCRRTIRLQWKAITWTYKSIWRARQGPIGLHGYCSPLISLSKCLWGWGGVRGGGVGAEGGGYGCISWSTSSSRRRRKFTCHFQARFHYNSFSFPKPFTPMLPSFVSPDPFTLFLSFLSRPFLLQFFFFFLSRSFDVFMFFFQRFLSSFSVPFFLFYFYFLDIFVKTLPAFWQSSFPDF